MIQKGKVGFFLRFVVFLSLALVLLTSSLLGQEQDSISLFNRQEKRFVHAASLTAAFVFTGAFMGDEAMRKWNLENQGSFGDSFSRYSNRLGDKKLVLSLNAALMATGYLADRPGLLHTSWNAAKSIVSTALITEGLKRGLGRARPYTEKGARHFNPFPPNRHAFKSLPSGHASLSFAFFTPFAEQYSRWIYLLPASTAFARVYKDKHWVSDVVLGATIGFLTGYFFQHKNQHLEVGLNGVTVYF
jgi:membrane-associated phospholipid phosphatase